MRILVTGGAGFLGRRVAAAARGAGHEVRVLTRRPERARDLAAGVVARAGDLLAPASLDEPLREAAPAAVVHAAAAVRDDDPELLAVNVGGTRALCRALLSLPNRPRLVYVSSFAVQDEPPTAYGQSKAAAEEVVRQSTLPFVIVRPTLLYGPNDPGNTEPLVAALRAGTMWLPAGGRARIQPAFVDDVAAACVEAVSRQGIEGRTYVLGGDEPVSVRAWRAAVRDATGGRARIRALPLPLLAPASRLLALLGRTRAADVVRFHRADHAVDSSSACAELGYRPRSLAAGLAATFGRVGAQEFDRA